MALAVGEGPSVEVSDGVMVANIAVGKGSVGLIKMGVLVTTISPVGVGVKLCLAAFPTQTMINPSR